MLPSPEAGKTRSRGAPGGARTFQSAATLERSTALENFAALGGVHAAADWKVRAPFWALLRNPFGILRLAMLLLLTLAGAGCRQSPTSSAASSPGWFEDVTAKSGVNFVHDVGAERQFFMPESVGSGCALFDYDNDGRLDIYLIQNAGPHSKSTNKLYHQGADGKFTDVSAGSGLDVAGYGMGVAIGDINNDGFPDVLVTEYARVRLFLNNGNGTFSDITREAGVDNPQWAVSAAFVDYDRDGWLDFVVVNYIGYVETQKCYDRAGKPEYCGPNSAAGTVSRLFHNLGRPPGSTPRVQFADVTVQAGLGDMPGPGLGVVCADFDGDHWPDILISNDARPNHLWINQRNGKFKNEAGPRGLAYNSMGIAEANMGIALADMDGDGLFDIFITHLTEENNVLWKQGPRGLFQDRTASVGLSPAAWHATGFGVVFGDFDQNGFPDLVVANGRVRRSNQPGVMAPVLPELGAHWSGYGERCQIFSNDGSNRFHEISLQNGALCGRPTVARGLACGDIDGDGALDLLITSIASPARIFRNVAPQRGHWLMVRAIEPALGGRDAYGAEITIQAGGRRRVGWLSPGASYGSSSDPRVHFGLDQTLQVDAIQVVWPEGQEEVFPGVRADQLVVLRKGQGKPAGR